MAKAKAKKKKKIPVVKRRRKIQIDVGEYSFWVECKAPNRAKLIPISSELAKYGDASKLKEEDIDQAHALEMMPLMLDILADCITDWEIEAEPDIEALNDLPMDVQATILDRVLIAGEQEKN